VIEVLEPNAADGDGAAVARPPDLDLPELAGSALVQGRRQHEQLTALVRAEEVAGVGDADRCLAAVADGQVGARWVGSLKLIAMRARPARQPRGPEPVAVCRSSWLPDRRTGLMR